MLRQTIFTSGNDITKNHIVIKHCITVVGEGR